MTYNASNEERNTLLELEKNSRGDYIVVSTITNKTSGNQSVDIRQFYTDKEGQVAPTSKGVRYSSEMAAEIVKALINTLEFDELMDLQDIINEKLTDEADDIKVEEEDVE